MDDFELFFTGEKAAEILEYFYKDKDKSKIFIWDFKVKDIIETFVYDHDIFCADILNTFDFWKVERQKVVLTISYSKDPEKSLIDALTQSMTYFLKKGKSLEKEKSLKDIAKSIKDEKSFFPLKKEVSTQPLKVKECIKYIQKELEKEKADEENDQFLESGEYIGDFLEYSVDDFLEKKTLKEKLEEQSGLVLFGSEGLESLEKVREWLGTSKKYFIERLLLIEYIKRLTPDDPEELSYSFLKA